MRSHQPVFHIVKCSSAAGDGLLLGFSVAPMLFILCRSVRPGGSGHLESVETSFARSHRGRFEC